MRIFTGYDPREALGTWVFQHSLMMRTPLRVSFQNIWNKGSTGTNLFTYERYRVPFLCDYKGPPVLFADGADMICQADISELNAHHQLGKALFVVKRPDYTATTPKYAGTEMESPNASYPRKNWSSFMVMVPNHFGWRRVDWSRQDPAYWHEFGWLKDSEIGELPDCWNRLVDEGDPVEGAKILHWTLGIPAMRAYAQAPGADLWFNEARAAMRVPA